MPVLMFTSWFLNEIWIIDLSSVLVGILISSSKLFLFSNKAHLNAAVRLLLELCCVNVNKHIAFFTICAKLTLAFTFASLPLNFYTSVQFSDVVVVPYLNKNIDGSTDSVKKKARIGGLSSVSFSSIPVIWGS